MNLYRDKSPNAGQTCLRGNRPGQGPSRNTSQVAVNVQAQAEAWAYKFPMNSIGLPPLADHVNCAGGKRSCFRSVSDLQPDVDSPEPQSFHSIATHDITGA